MTMRFTFLDAASQGDDATVRTMLSAPGVQSFINYQDGRGFTPLHVAAFEGHASITKRLLEAGSDSELLDMDGRNSLQVAQQQDNTVVIFMFILHHYTTPEGMAELLIVAAEGNDTAKVRTLLSKQGVESFINYPDGNGATPLLVAAWHGHASVTKQLIEARCNIDLPTLTGTTPLHAAAMHGHAAVTK